jgi:hypothetical protein
MIKKRVLFEMIMSSYAAALTPFPPSYESSAMLAVWIVLAWSVMCSWHFLCVVPLNKDCTCVVDYILFFN